MSEKLRVTDVIKEEDIHSWESGDIITIESPTDSGKSYFIKNKLYHEAKKNNQKILMLIHRTNCVDQFRMEIKRDGKEDTIDVITYQKIEHLYKNKKTFDFSKYVYICLDEMQYFLGDSAYNKLTDISLKAILDQKSKIRIFMSGTGKYMCKFLKDYLKLQTIDYKLETNFSFIEKLVFFNADETLEYYMQQAIDTNTKTIFFIQSATKAYQLHKKFISNSTFNCGKSDKHFKYVDEEKIKSMLVNERFDDLILITTTCLDAGVNLIDLDLTHVVTDVKDIDVLIQCIGRKRQQHENDKITLIIKNISNNVLGGMETQLMKRVEMSDYLNDHTVKEFVEHYDREYDRYNIVYDEAIADDNNCTKQINQLMRFKCKIDTHVISEMKTLGDFSYCKYVARLFGFYNEDRKYYDYTMEGETEMKLELEEYLDSLVGKKLYKNEQQDLKEFLKNNGLKAKTMGINTINGNLKDRKLPYVIESGNRKSYRDEGGKVKKDLSNWVIGKLIYQL